MTIKENFWLNLKKPLKMLAPMEDVTDTVFRQLILETSQADQLDVIFTEFVSTDGLCHEVGRKKVIHRLLVNDSERALLKQKKVKLVAQIWGKRPETFYKATRMIMDEMDFDGIDINMGCPVPKIVKNGCCSGLIKDPILAKEIILATKEAAKVPVSVKTRIGFDKVVTESWINQLLEVDPAAIILHGRIQEMQSNGQADWNEIAKAVRIRDMSGKNIPLIGNGDATTLQDITEKIEQSGVDGVMVGRGIFHNPWFFSDRENVSVAEKMSLLRHHTELFHQTWGKQKNIEILKRFYKIYLKDFEGANRLRRELMEAKGYGQVETILKNFNTACVLKS